MSSRQHVCWAVLIVALKLTHASSSTSVLPSSAQYQWRVSDSFMQRDSHQMYACSPSRTGVL